MRQYQVNWQCIYHENSLKLIKIFHHDLLLSTQKQNHLKDRI